jgi:hypothetical protein
MRIAMGGIGLVFFVGLVTAADPLPLDRAQNAAKLVAAQAKKLTDAQIKTDVDTEKPFGLKKGELAALIIPDKSLSAERLAKAGKDILPVGQLWMRGLTPVVSDTATPNDKLRQVKVTAKGEDHELTLYLLGVRKGAKEKLELLVYAKAKEPLLVLPLEAGSKEQEQPIELEGKGEGEQGTLLLHILGKYQAKLPIAKQSS